MGWGIDFNTDIFLSKMSFNSKSDVERKIEENLESIEDAKKRLSMFIASTPKDIIDPEWQSQPIDWLYDNANNQFDIIESSIKENVLLNLYLDYLKDGGKEKI